MVALKDGRAHSFSSADLVSHADNLWSNSLSQSGDNLDPVFMSCDLDSPLGFASFLACSTHFKKVFIPGSYNMSSLLKALPTQNSSMLVCDEDFYSLQAPPSGDYKEMCAGVKHVLVAGKKGQSELFASAKASAVDPVSLQ